MGLEEKVDGMLALLHSMKPVIDSSAASLLALDQRQRSMEISSAQNDVRVARLISDLDGLGRKVRALTDRRRLHEAGAAEGTRWMTFLTILAALPKYWPVIVAVGGFVTTAAVILWKHWPRGS